MTQDEFYNEVEAEAFFLRSLSSFSPQEFIQDMRLRENKQSILDYLQSLTDLENLTVLEVGCSVGDLLYVLRQKYGCKVLGVEPSRSASEIASQSLGLDVFHGTFLRSPFFSLSESDRNQLDMIILDDVVGWMSPELLLPTLGALDWALKPGGQIFVRELYSPFPYRVQNRHHPDLEIYQHRYQYGVGSFLMNTGGYVVTGAREYATSQLQDIETDVYMQIWRDSLLRKSEKNLLPAIKMV